MLTQMPYKPMAIVLTSMAINTSVAVVVTIPDINAVSLGRVSSDGAHAGIKSSGGSSLSLGVIHSPVLGLGLILSLQLRIVYLIQVVMSKGAFHTAS